MSHYIMSQIISIEEFDKLMELEDSIEEYTNMIEEVKGLMPEGMLHEPSLFAISLYEGDVPVPVIITMLVMLRYGIENADVKQTYSELIDKLNEMVRENYDKEVEAYSSVLNATKLTDIKFIKK